MELWDSTAEPHVQALISHIPIQRSPQNNNVCLEKRLWTSSFYRSIFLWKRTLSLCEYLRKYMMCLYGLQQKESGSSEMAWFPGYSWPGPRHMGAIGPHLWRERSGRPHLEWVCVHMLLPPLRRAAQVSCDLHPNPPPPPPPPRADWPGVGWVLCVTLLLESRDRFITLSVISRYVPVTPLREGGREWERGREGERGLLSMCCL